MKTRTTSTMLATVAAILFAVPALAAAATPGRTTQIRTQIADYLTRTRYVPPNVRLKPIDREQIRFRSTVDKNHDKDGHVHVVGHTVRQVKFQANGLQTPVEGRALSDTLLTKNGPTTVSNIKVELPRKWGQPPAAAK